MAGYGYVACGGDHVGHSSRCASRVSQRLVVVKDMESGDEAFYIESVVPAGGDDCDVES